MKTLTHDEILGILAAATTTRLLDSRSALLAGIAPDLVATLPLASSSRDQILSDLDVLNTAGALSDGTAPLAMWLATATALTGVRAESSIFRQALHRCRSATSQIRGPVPAFEIHGRHDEAPRSSCFLSYGRSYAHLRGPFSRLLETAGFDRVEHSDIDGSDDSNEGIFEYIKRARAMVVLYGPKSRSSKDTQTGDERSVQEALLARGLRIPTLFIVHEGSTGSPSLPPALGTRRGHVTFNFWDPQSFMDNCHNLVAALLDFSNRQGRIASESPRFKYRFASFRHHILANRSTLEVYHEAVAFRTCGVFHHSFDNDKNFSIAYPKPEDLKYQLVKRRGPAEKQISVRFGRCSASEIEYFIDVVPSLQPGESLGYWRSFDLPTTFPLSASDLAKRILDTKPSPGEWDPLPNGTYWDIVYDMDEFTMALHFPPGIEIVDYGINVLHYVTREDHPEETARCRPAVRFIDDPSRERVLEVTIERPLINHRYCLFYVPA